MATKSKSKNKKDELDGLYTAGLVLGIIGLVFACIPVTYWLAYIFGGLALVFGIIGLVRKTGGSRAIAATALGGIAVLIGIIMNVMWVNFWNTTVDFLTGSTSDAVNEFLEEYDNDALGTKVSVELGQYQDATDDTWSEKALPVTITNIADKTLSFSVSVEAIDEDGNRIDEDTIYAQDLAPGQSYTEEAFDWSSVDEEILEEATFRVYRASSY